MKRSHGASWHAVRLAHVFAHQNEDYLTVAPTDLANLLLAGVIVTGDALFTQRQLSAQIVQQGRHYIWMVKKNQRQLYEDLTLAFAQLRA